jgi:circadian clock protein KaiC
MHFMKEAVRRSERSVIYLFEEGIDTVVQRSESIGIPAKRMIAKGNLALVPITPLRLTSEEFAALVREEVEERNARIVMLDSIAGYQLSIQGGESIPHLQALIRYLRNMGITLILTHETDIATGPLSTVSFGFSYLADNVIFMRYVENRGRLQKAIGVLKKRASDFDKALHELDITDRGLRMGAALEHVTNIFSDMPAVRADAEVRKEER